eukprot:10437781-Heterocapsa_arctica.AAC.2
MIAATTHILWQRSNATRRVVSYSVKVRKSRKDSTKLMECPSNGIYMDGQWTAQPPGNRHRHEWKHNQQEDNRQTTKGHTTELQRIRSLGHVL